MIVVLPWPPKELSPNARTHWARKAAAAKMYRNLAHWSTVALGAKAGASVSVKFSPPDLRPRDLDNMLASIKSGLDGIASAIGIDDSQWSLTITKGEPVKGGLVTVEVTA
jgi:crossover junction endodeoxyribonuclease RusA